MKRFIDPHELAREARFLRHTRTTSTLRDRREAGVREREREERRENSSAGPARESLREAARILRERHPARPEATLEGVSA